MPNELAVIDALGEANRFFTAESALEAVTQILYTQQLHRPIVGIGHQIDRPLARNILEKRLKVRSRIEVDAVIEEVAHESIVALARAVGPKAFKSHRPPFAPSEARAI